MRTLFLTQTNYFRARAEQEGAVVGGHAVYGVLVTCSIFPDIVF
jgi:hypothetical protein